MKKFVACSAVAIALMVVVGLAQTVSANPPGGPISGLIRVQAHEVNVHTITYKGGERADFAIVGDGYTSLNVLIQDEKGNVVRRTQGPGDRINVNWLVPRTGVYYIFVINEGGVYNQYAWRAY
jgi:hypothetical protein